MSLGLLVVVGDSLLDIDIEGTADRLSPLHQLRYARELCEVADGGLPGADQFDAQLVALPIYPRLPDGAADRVAEVLAGMLSVDSSS